MDSDGVAQPRFCGMHLEVRGSRTVALVDAPRRCPERLRSAPARELLIRTRVEPALHLAEAILVIWGLCADGHTNREGRPAPLLGALLLTRYRREIRYRQPPDAVQRLLFPPLAALARRRGLEATIERYLDIASHPSAEAGLGRLPSQVMAGRA